MAKRKREKSVLVRFTEDEYEKVQKNIQKSKLSQQDYLLKTALNKDIYVIDGLEETIEQLRKIGVNFNQLVKLANMAYIDDCSKELQELSEEMKNIWQLLKTTLSKTH